MLDQHPYLLENLFKMRAQEFEQNAANHRLLIDHRANPSGLHQQLRRITGLLATIFFALWGWQLRQPSSRCC